MFLEYFLMTIISLLIIALGGIAIYGALIELEDKEGRR